ncbi:magnesium transporter [Halopseudomonas formosensis]|uniref:Magnesium transporter MgtE n=1 Tax=Halopseudomonas formosensis TaxID=1002526 RepID=A0A1I6BTM5_9GAMM|nr:magnesium transporter [Halopseudomonas formosensis]SFQ84271.1 magnesium transporter [Halopseudomonas formosensis]
MELDINLLRDSLRRGNSDELATALKAHHPADLAAALQDLEPSVAWDILHQAAIPRQAAVFGYLDPDFRTLLVNSISQQDLAAIVMHMRADDRADLYRQLTEEQRETLMPALAQAEREDIRRLAAYREGTAGAIMTSAYAALPPGISASDALAVLRREAPNKETIYRAYVIDSHRKLLGSVRLQDLITAPAQTRVSALMKTCSYQIRVDEDAEEAARRIAHYDVIALPVVDADNRLVGIITHDDALDVLQAGATEDFHRVGTVTHLESGVGSASIPMLYRARIVWLMLLVFGSIFSGAGIAHFEDTIAANLALMFFLPILISSGGNAGSQSATLMIRALATGEIGLSDWTRVLGRELVLAMLLGVSMACAIGVIGVVRGGQQIALVISLSMVLIVVVGSLIGMLLPFLLSRFRLDPATASTPLVTSIADATGVLIYFSIASVLLNMPA